LIRLRKIKQDNTLNCFRYVPFLDFSKQWTDQELYEYFNLTQDEIDLIENTIKDKPAEKIQKSVGASIAKSSYKFVKGEIYKYTPKRKTKHITGNEVVFCGYHGDKAKIKDINGDKISYVSVETLEVKN